MQISKQFPFEHFAALQLRTSVLNAEKMEKREVNIFTSGYQAKVEAVKMKRDCEKSTVSEQRSVG